jgi:sugar phosphate isomerase/epimerase
VKRVRFGGFLAGVAPDWFGFADWWEALTFQLDWAKRLGWRCFIPNGFGGWSLEQQREAVQAMRQRDLLLPGLGAYHLNLLHPDPDERARIVRQIIALVERAAELGIPTVDNIAGVWHPEGGHMFYPRNKSPEAWETFVRGVKEICRACRGTGVRFTLEPYITTLLDSPQALRKAVELIDMPDELGINFDLVNMVGYERYHDINALVDETIEAVGDFIVLAHLKDVRYLPDLSLRVAEVVPGEGAVDFVHWLRQLGELEKRTGRELPAFIEHLRTMDEMTRAWQHIRQCAQKAGLMA